MTSTPTGDSTTNILWGMGLGITFGCFLVALDMLFRRYNLRAFNIAIIGVFIGYLMGEALLLVFNAILEISSISVVIQPQTLEIIKIALFLFGIYLGTIMTLRASDELYVSIPFVKFTQTTQKKKDLIVDTSVLADARIIDVVATGLFDHQLIIPRFVIKELYAQSETGDEPTRVRARRCLDVSKKLEAVPHLELRYNDTDFPEVKDTTGKLVRLARLLDANILSADVSRVQMSSIEGISIINMHSLSNALKPLMQAGEFIRIKIQRYGKEPRQGVGYLEDGTMVVVNGGGDFIGDLIDARVLSVKHTTSGRMIFCNVADESGEAPSGFEVEDV
ncbi:MAG: TRAM domain-containing protein [Verrucomicrobia bacterium]|nr:TRAM domain-containing protein [Verrucomicrobiota bacterium]